jgi:hypothetical protein
VPSRDDFGQFELKPDVARTIRDGLDAAANGLNRAYRERATDKAWYTEHT